jgi:hypothetical protein
MLRTSSLDEELVVALPGLAGEVEVDLEGSGRRSGSMPGRRDLKELGVAGVSDGVGGEVSAQDVGAGAGTVPLLQTSKERDGGGVGGDRA